MRGTPLPPLITAGSVGDAVPGALGLPGTVVLFGGRDVGTDARSGGRIMGGWWFGDDHCLGLEAGGFFLGQNTRNFSATSFGTPLLARPFVDANTGLENVELVAAPNVLAGMISAHSSTSFWGYEANVRSTCLCGPCFFVDGIIGYRSLGLDDKLSVTENLTVLRAPGGNFLVNDSFATSNRFHGGQMGFIAEYKRGAWSLDLTTKVALGGTHQTVTINGSTVITDPVNGTSVSRGGLLAQPSNSGQFKRDVFSVVPEVGLNLGYQFTDHIRGFVGYNFLYWSNVVRAGNQVDRVVNPNVLPPAQPGGAARPLFSYNGSEFWAQGVNFGLEFRY
jgi:hypothetical protein